MTFVGTRASRRPRRTSSVSWAPWTSTASGRNVTELLRHAKRQERVERGAVECARTHASERAGSGDRSRSRRPSVPSTRTSSSASSASNFWASEGESGSEYRIRPTIRSLSASSHRRPLELRLDAREDRLLGVCGNRDRAPPPPDAGASRRRRRSGEWQSPRAAGSFGATRSPFSPSRTTSGTPPTAVAITGVPTARASSTVCGRFSQAELSTAASAARKSRSTPSRGTDSEEPSAPVDSELVRAPLQLYPLRPVSDDEEIDVGDRGERFERDLRAPSAVRGARRRRASAGSDPARHATLREWAASARSARDSEARTAAPGRDPIRARRHAGTRSDRRCAARGVAPRFEPTGERGCARSERPGTRRASPRSAPRVAAARRPRRRRA